MEVLRLNQSTYLPNGLIEGYNSMIWTERYLTNGDFVMKTAKIAETMSAIPIGSFISLRDSNEMMVVETYEIGRDSEGYPELTVKGRTFDTFLENRILLAAVYNTPWSTYKTYKASEISSLLLWNALVNTTGEDPTRAAQTIDSRTYISNLVITDSSTFTDSAQAWWLEQGQADGRIRDILVYGGLGIRNIRPCGSTGEVMTFDTTRTTSRGTVTKTHTTNISQLRVDVYNGLDKSRQQSERTPIIFHYDSGHIDLPTYLFSDQDYKNMATISSSIGSIDVWPTTGTTPPTPNPIGLLRRTLFIDGGDMGSLDYATYVQSIVQKALIELKKQTHVVVFDGAISPLAPYKYNSDYSLGDVVTLMAEYGYEAAMLVSEYVRTEDSEGDRGFPGLSTL